jgi:hypothetical protein
MRRGKRSRRAHKQRWMTMTTMRHLLLAADADTVDMPIRMARRQNRL